jgi:hypothetical protein
LKTDFFVQNRCREIIYTSIMHYQGRICVRHSVAIATPDFPPFFPSCYAL